jgi:flagellar motility protein MotE (MotC chaperone)
MSPDAAAERLVRLYDPRDVAAILYFMAERSAASILAAMEPGYAANITEIMLYN